MIGGRQLVAGAVLTITRPGDPGYRFRGVWRVGSRVTVDSWVTGRDSAVASLQSSGLSDVGGFVVSLGSPASRVQPAPLWPHRTSGVDTTLDTSTKACTELAVAASSHG